MSKQSDAKAIQNYTEKPFVKMCGNCEHLATDERIHAGTFGSVVISHSLRCSLGGFKVKKTAVCQDWEAKP